MAKAALEPQGRYEELRGELIGLYSDANEADDGSFRAPAEYLVTRRPAAGLERRGALGRQLDAEGAAASALELGDDVAVQAHVGELVERRRRPA